MSKTFDEIIEERHSCRMFPFLFDSAPVSDEIISRIVKRIDLCPNSFGPHSFHTYVVTNRDLIEKITSASGQNWVKSAPLLFVFCSECEDSSWGDRAISLWYIQDAAIAQTYALLAVQEEGLRSCWVGGFDESKVKKILNIPSHFRPVGIQACGYDKKSRVKKYPRVFEDTFTYCK
ncbi:uncharacterized protein [Blastocystis hominis]|uniref:Nitroreductase domain-containing protein n=1 Tax=Blastocystis hominis TaxID=12968 RepID=D8LY08_BLAHO|nr:uncharacterized protein [Blastocystis hominis]CBK20463.2 unnamed protein product [Blastocystis hominis]|eukprot:XP_012894511.1 uncharacterized protein [Blastocystis hominis]